MSHRRIRWCTKHQERIRTPEATRCMTGWERVDGGQDDQCAVAEFLLVPAGRLDLEAIAQAVAVGHSTFRITGVIPEVGPLDLAAADAVVTWIEGETG